MDIQLEKAVAIDGWMSIRELSWLVDIARRSSSILEVGCYKGRSTKAMADATLGTVDVVDPFKGSYYNNDGSVLFTHNSTKKIFIHNLRDHLLSHKLFIWEMKFEEINPIKKYDFVFIDGDHRYEKVLHDIVKGYGLVSPHGILAGHDYGQEDWPGVKQAVDEIFGSSVKLIDTIWYVHV